MKKTIKVNDKLIFTSTNPNHKPWIGTKSVLKELGEILTEVTVLQMGKDSNYIVKQYVGRSATHHNKRLTKVCNDCHELDCPTHIDFVLG